MGLLIKIAWRNIWRHKGKSLIVGSILFMGTTVMTVGTGVISGMDAGLRTHIVKGFTGDIVLASTKQQADNVFIDMTAQAVEVLPDYERVKELLAKSTMVDRFLPIGKNAAMVLNEDGGSMDGAFVLGVDMEQYQAMFPDNLEVLQGTMLKPGESGAMLATGAQKNFVTSMGLFFMPESSAVDTSIMPPEAKKMKDQLSIKRSMVFMGFSDANTSTDVRVPIRALVKYRALNSIFGMFVITDIESFRQCLGYISAAGKSVEIPNATRKLLSFDDASLEGLFGEGDLVVANAPAIARESTAKIDMQKPMTVDIDEGSYNLVLVRLKDGIDKQVAADSLKALFEREKVDVRPIVWDKAIGTIGSLAMLIKSSLFVFVMLLFFVAVVIIINTLSMAALERVSEIGMMRAVGARKGFIGQMFVVETATLSAFFGALGIMAGWVVVTIFSAVKLTTKNDMVQLLYGGDVFAPFLTADDFVLVLVQLVLVVLLAVVYPVIVARNITPLDAVSRE